MYCSELHWPAVVSGHIGRWLLPKGDGSGGGYYVGYGYRYNHYRRGDGSRDGYHYGFGDGYASGDGEGIGFAP